MTAHARTAERKHRIAGFELRDVLADRFDVSCELAAENALPRSGDTQDRAREKAEAERHRETSALQSPDDTVVARTLVRTSLSLGTGLSTTFNSTTSGGPYRSYTAALIVVACASCCLGLLD